MAPLLNKLETGTCLRRTGDNRRDTGRDDRREVRSRDKSERIQRRRLIFIRALDFLFARLVYMGMVRMIVVVRVEVRVDQRSMIMRISIGMDVL